MDARILISLSLILLPSFLWLLLKQFYSPWWLENLASSPLIIVPINLLFMLLLMKYLSYGQCFTYFFINLSIAIFINNWEGGERSSCDEPIEFFQFNMKYMEQESKVDELLHQLLTKPFDLIALQGVSQKAKRNIINKLMVHYPYFITGENQSLAVRTDQLIFSRFALSDMHYVKSGNSSFLMSSHWHLPQREISLFTLHPPSPRNEALWLTRNKVLYQLKQGLEKSKESGEEAIVIGDLNLSKHSARMKIFPSTMSSSFVNSWPSNIPFAVLGGLAIDHFWLSNSGNICQRKLIKGLKWSDHFPIHTTVTFDKK